MAHNPVKRTLQAMLALTGWRDRGFSRMDGAHRYEHLSGLEVLLLYITEDYVRVEVRDPRLPGIRPRRAVATTAKEVLEILHTELEEHDRTQ